MTKDSQSTNHRTGTPTAIPGLLLTDHRFTVPLDYGNPNGGQIEVFAREVAAPGGEERPFLVFFQGGPGSESPRPKTTGGWLSAALAEFRVLLLDQRGTGRSSPIGALPGLQPEEQAAYLTNFRADSIIRDAELIRQILGVERWSVMGQSFGGFCVMTYLSFAPEALCEALLTGGLSAVGRPIDDVYRETYRIVHGRNHRFYSRYPDDLTRVGAIQERVDADPLRLPSGDVLVVNRFKHLGSMLGRSDGAEALHYLIELATDSPGFLSDVEAATAFGRNPIYAILHEACWADGGVTNWAAERVMPTELQAPEMFTGEHIYPWMFEDYGSLRPLAAAANILAHHSWTRLYDPDILRRNDVPVAAAVYYDDMYVPFKFSVETADLIRGCRPWITNEYEHNGLSSDGPRVFGRLLDMVRGRA